MPHGFLRFIDPLDVTPEDLPYIEDPDHAAERLDQVPAEERYRLVREMPHLFVFDHEGMALHAFHREIKEALAEGEVLLLNPDPVEPVLRRQTTDAGERWVYDENDFHSLFFIEEMAWLLHHCEQETAASDIPFRAPAPAAPLAALDEVDHTEAVHRDLQQALARQAATAPPKGIVTGLGADVDALAAQSPRLQGQLKQLHNQNWTFGYGQDGASKTVVKTKDTPAHIDIKPDAEGHPERVVQQLSHEVGHALHPVTPDMSSRQAYIDSNLTGEGWATMNNLAVQQEIRAASGTDIRVASAHPNELGPQYQAIYDRSLRDGDADRAAREIGQLYGQNEITGGSKDVPGVPYRDYYGNGYDHLPKH